MTDRSLPKTVSRPEPASQSKPPTVAAKPSLDLTYIVQKGANALPFLKK